MVKAGTATLTITTLSIYSTEHDGTQLYENSPQGDNQYNIKFYPDVKCHIFVLLF